METIKASVACVDDKHFIKLLFGDEEICIPMSEDRPNEVKSAFNKLMMRLRAGEFHVKLDEVRDDLFSQVANEYITQLNREIREVHSEMKQHNLILQSRVKIKDPGQ